MIYLKKNPRESNEKLISRFQKKVQGSRIILMAKERMYYKKPLKKSAIRKRAIMRDYYRAQREKQKYLWYIMPLMIIAEALQNAHKVLQNSLEAEILLAFLLHKPREYIFSHPRDKLSTDIVLQFKQFSRSRARGVPLAYITHHKEFFGLDFYPRQETSAFEYLFSFQ